MSRWEKWLSHLSTVVVSVSGIVYLWMKYFMTTDDPFALVNHPLQPSMMSVHVLAAPVLTFMLGLIVNSHARKKLASPARSNRVSGLVALSSFPVMVLSGYLLQISTNELLTKVSLGLHLVTSGAFALTYAVHLLISLRLMRNVPVVEKTRSHIRQQPA